MTEKRISDIEEEIARKYHQPRNVEQFGIEQIPHEKKTVKWYDLFLIIINFLMNPAMILIGGSAVAAGLSFWGAVTAEVVGVAVAYMGYLVMATMGVDYGVPGAVGSRIVYGIIGSKFTTSLIRLASSIYWFAFQTIAGAEALLVILQKIFGIHVSLVTISLIFAVFQVLVASVGYDLLKSLSRAAFIVKIFAIAMVVYLFMTYSDPNFAPIHVFSYHGTVGWKWGVFIVWVNSLAATWLSMITDAADFCRYSRTRTDMWVGTMLAACVGTFTSAFIGAYSSAATFGKVPNGLQGAANVAHGIFPLVILLLMVLLDNWTINVSNLYTGALCVVNMVPRLGRFWATLMVSVVGVLLSLFPGLLNAFLGTMNYSGTLFASLAAVLITDYAFIKKRNIVVSQLYEPHGIYRYTGGWNISALVWTLIGFAVYNLTPASWFQVFVCYVVTSVGYYWTQRLSGRIQKDLAIIQEYSTMA